MVGSTAHADGADPEDVRDRNQLYFNDARARIEHYGGIVEKYIGDAVMAVFGAPLARSDDAERAVRAALSIIEGIRELNERHPGLDLEVRGAVCTGEAMVAIDAAPGDALATGDVVNTAARLQNAAPPGGVLVGRGDLRLTRHAFAFEELAPIEAKGKRDPVPRGSCGEPLDAPAARPVPRRRWSVATASWLLDRVWDRAVSLAAAPRDGPGAGRIGKSRLAREVARSRATGGRRAVGSEPARTRSRRPYRAAARSFAARRIFENDRVEARARSSPTQGRVAVPGGRGRRGHALP